MSQIIFLAAVANNNVIGYQGGIPWYHPIDLKRFKRITMGCPVVMGRKTWESLPIKPLPGRFNVVLTRTLDDGRCEKFDDLRKVIVKYRHRPKIYVIGGQKIFEDYMDFADVLDITHIYEDYEGDTFFPEIDMSVWYRNTMYHRSPVVKFAIYRRRAL